jgi:signal transduction histidine kinase
MAEVATSVLHNVGNVLNSVNVSTILVAEQVKKSKVTNLAKAAGLMNENAADLGGFMTHDPRGKQLPGYLTQLAGHLATEQTTLLVEMEQLRKNIEHIKDIVAMQQSYAKFSGVTETLKVSDLVEDALRMNAGALTRHEVEVICEYAEIPPVTIDKHKVLQVLVNLIRNAKYACDESGRPDKRLTVRVANGEGRLKIAIIDNGVGIPPENLVRIFNHGFTTRKDGHGFGLHSGALAAKELGGSLHVQSGGTGLGATFILELPFDQTQPVV